MGVGGVSWNLEFSNTRKYFKSDSIRFGSIENITRSNIVNDYFTVTLNSVLRASLQHFSKF